MGEAVYAIIAGERIFMFLNAMGLCGAAAAESLQLGGHDWLVG